MEAPILREFFLWYYAITWFFLLRVFGVPPKYFGQQRSIFESGIRFVCVCVCVGVCAWCVWCVCGAFLVVFFRFWCGHFFSIFAEILEKSDFGGF